MTATVRKRLSADEAERLRTCPLSELPYYLTTEEAMVRVREDNYEVFLRWVRSGRVPARRIGKRYLIQRDFFA